MINLTKIYSYTQDIVETDKSLNINQFTYGDIYDKLNVKENKYPTLHYSLNNVTQYNNTVSYNFDVFYVDRLLENNKNETGIIDDSYMTIQRVINTFSDGVDDAGENVNIKVSNNFEFFKEDFADRCAGCYVNVQFEVLNYVGRCHDVDVPVYPIVDLETLTLEFETNGVYTYKAEKGKAWNELEITVNVAGGGSGETDIDGGRASEKYNGTRTYDGGDAYSQPVKQYDGGNAYNII